PSRALVRFGATPAPAWTASSPALGKIANGLRECELGRLPGGPGLDGLSDSGTVLHYFFMRTLGVLPSAMNQIAPPSLKLMLNTSESDDIPPMPDRTLPYRAVATARLSATGVPVLGSWGSAWPSHHLNWERLPFPSLK